MLSSIIIIIIISYVDTLPTMIHFYYFPNVPSIQICGLKNNINIIS